jgi:hypothetical protein
MAAKKKKAAKRAGGKPKVFTRCTGEDGFCKVRRPAGDKARVDFPGFDYTQPGVDGRKGPVCNIQSSRCPVQLVFKAGRPYVRFCETTYQKGTGTGRGRTKPTQGKPAADIPADNAQHAQRMAHKACSVWGGGQAAKRRNFANIDWQKLAKETR